MFIEFTLNNFKSFKSEQVLSMKPFTIQELDYSVLDTNRKINKKKIKALSTAVLYGPNASGKSNIIGAIEILKNIVLRGSIKDCMDINSGNHALKSMRLIPNNSYKEPQPTEFSIEFFTKDVLIKYKISINFISFLNENSSKERYIESEELFLNEKWIFKRKKNQITINHTEIKKHYSNLSLDKIEGIMDVINSSVSEKELFLTNGFKMYSNDVVQKIINWFESSLCVIYHSDSMNSCIKKSAFNNNSGVFIDENLNQAAKEFGINSNSLGYCSVNNNSEEDEVTQLSSLIKPEENTTIVIPAEVFESRGTIRFINMLPILLFTMETGGVLIVDEFDSQLHPMALMNITNIFHNNDINKNHAQLIFNTHNPVFLNRNLFRRDEIKFVERDKDNHTSSIYSLADFGTSGENGVRNTEDYMKNYFINKYGAIENIDFSDVFKNAIKDSDLKDNEE